MAYTVDTAEPVKAYLRAFAGLSREGRLKLIGGYLDALRLRGDELRSESSGRYPSNSSLFSFRYLFRDGGQMYIDDRFTNSPQSPVAELVRIRARRLAAPEFLLIRLQEMGGELTKWTASNRLGPSQLKGTPQTQGPFAELHLAQPGLTGGQHHQFRAPQVEVLHLQGGQQTSWPLTTLTLPGPTRWGQRGGDPCCPGFGS